MVRLFGCLRLAGLVDRVDAVDDVIDAAAEADRIGIRDAVVAFVAFVV